MVPAQKVMQASLPTREFLETSSGATRRHDGMWDDGGMRPLVVASASPRRHDLLRRHGYRFTIAPADIDERAEPGESSRVMVMRLALAKAMAVAPAATSESVVLGVDTIVDLEGAIIGKPASAAEAVNLLHRLSDRTHTVFTGFALVAATGLRASVDVASSRVSFRMLGEREVADYVASGEPLDKAGAYAIQESGGSFVANLEGSITNVMGLPMETLEPLLHNWGIAPDSFA